MALASGVTTPLVVEIKDRTRLVFKKHPFEAVEDDLQKVLFHLCTAIFSTMKTLGLTFTAISRSLEM